MDFIRSHMAVLPGVDFFTAEVLTWRGLATYYVLAFIHLESRRVSLAGLTRYPNEPWMQQMARNATDESWGYLDQRRYVLHDRDTKFCASFRTLLSSGGIKPLALPPRSPNLNAFAERWVRSAPLGQTRMSVETHLIRRRLPAPCAGRIHRALSR
jgi:putative transposase